MSTTVFCTFEQQDFADLASGRLRVIPGVHSIHAVVEHGDPGPRYGPANMMGIIGAVGAAGSEGLGGLPAAAWEPADGSGPTGRPSPATGLKIVCENRALDRVVSALVNLHAHRIVTIP